MQLSNEVKKAYRSIGHKLNPIVIISGNGVSENVLQELLRALSDHELIKVKYSVGDRDTKKQLIDETLAKTDATLVQQIGNVALLLKPNPQANPNLSNIERYKED